MILINSSAYVISEFQAEVGRVPPCMLPVGNQKLLEKQFASIHKAFPDENIYVALPESYRLTLNEKYLLESLGVTPLFVPDDFSLGESIHYALDTIVSSDQMVRLVYGDVLIEDFPPSDQIDIIGLSKSKDGYREQAECLHQRRTADWCGYFCFSDRAALVRALAITHGNFYQSSVLYNENYPLRSVYVDQWYDFGHINTYFKSRAVMTTQRSFNDIQVHKGVLTKTGQPATKIQAEASWFIHLPARLKRYIPQFISETHHDKAHSSYQLEYLPLLPLNELFVHGRNPPSFWKDIFRMLAEFLQDCGKFDIGQQQRDQIRESVKALYKTKTDRRLKEFAKKNKFDLDLPMRYQNMQLPSVNAIAEECIHTVMNLPIYFAVVHGDLCFSNVLHDSRLNSIKVIDPRGVDEQGAMTMYGDQKYDLAKLVHSIIGMYDFIIAGRYRLTTYDQTEPEINFDLDERIYQIQDDFRQLKVGSLPSVQQIMPLTILLFLSMLPLHADRPDRQQAMLVNALRLYSEYMCQGHAGASTKNKNTDEMARKNEVRKAEYKIDHKKKNEVA